MQIGRVASIAISGLRAETARLATSAQNVANINTDGYQPERVVSHERAGGGVSTQVVPTYDASGRASALAEPGPSQTDLAEERVAQLNSVHAYQAQLAVLRTADEMLGELVRQKA
jgi:flagellar hook protein FlgE